MIQRASGTLTRAPYVRFHMYILFIYNILIKVSINNSITIFLHISGGIKVRTPIMISGLTISAFCQLS